MPGPWGSYGVGGSMWKYAYQKAGALVSRSHHHRQQSMNEYEPTFMNILLSVIFLFQLSFPFLFPFFQHSQIFSCYSNLPLSLPCFIFLRLCLSLLLWCVLGHRVFSLPQGVTSAPRSYLNLVCPKDFWSLTQNFKKTRTLPQSSHGETVVKFFRFFLHIHQCRDVGYPLSKFWHPSSWDNHKDGNQLCFFHSAHSNYALLFFSQYGFALCFPLLEAMSLHLYLSALFHHLGKISTQPMTNIKNRRSYFK